MIQNVITVINKEINSYFKSRFDLTEDRLLVSHLVNQDGSVAFNGENKMVCSLINVEQEKVNLNVGTSAMPKINPPVNLNLYLLYSAYFTSENVDEAFKFLTAVIAFFQRKAVFTPQNTPMLSPQVNKISFEMINLDLGEMSNLWAALGAKYIPSVIYKLRMISINEEAIIADTPPISGLE